VAGLIGIGIGVSVGPKSGDLLASTASRQPSQPASVARAPSVMLGSDTIANLVERVDGSVVSIDTIARSEVDPLFGLFFGDSVPQTQEQRGVGSGFIVDESGLIVTNHHVIREANEISVALASGRRLQGRVVGSDPANDLALIKVNDKNLPALRFAAAEQTRVGDWVLAIGSPLGLSHTVSVGIVSALNRGIAISDRVNFLQTDAAINPGNSGGPLLNLRGDVVGVNTAVATQGQGIGFAIPAWTAQNIVNQLRSKGRVQRSWLGVSIRDFAQDNLTGIAVMATAPGGPAEKGGLRPGDLIIAVDDRPVKNSRDLLSTLNDRAAGITVKLTIIRQGVRDTVKVVLQAAPGNYPER